MCITNTLAAKLFDIPVHLYEAGNVVHQDVHVGGDLGYF